MILPWAPEDTTTERPNTLRRRSLAHIGRCGWRSATSDSVQLSSSWIARLRSSCLPRLNAIRGCLDPASLDVRGTMSLRLSESTWLMSV